MIKRIANKILSKGDGNGAVVSGEKSVPCEYFAKFLKAKVDKKRDSKELRDLSAKIDLDKDGNIDVNDLETCLGQINHEGFFSKAQSTTVSAFSASTTPIKQRIDHHQQYNLSKSEIKSTKPLN